MNYAIREMLLIFMVGLIHQIESKFTDVVYTTKGPVQGEILRTVISHQEYSSFKGIPYAEAPVGKLRFKPPIEKKSWSQVLQTTVEGANCVQKDFVYQHNFTGSEDCLYLNVYTPEITLNETQNNLYPVIVWIHGGTFKAGYGNSSLYGPDFIIEEKVAVVTFNYRLGPLGFLSLHHEEATGNAGLKDQNLVLRWVKQNIIKFGGNPNNVTLVGQSAGGVAVDLHSLSGMSEGLFHRSISMSASPLCPWAFHTPDVAEKQAFKLGYELGLAKGSQNKNELLQMLYEAPAVLLMQITQKLGSSNPPFAPTIERSDIAPNEEKFLTECSYKKYLDGNFMKVPYLTGFTKHETLLFTHSMNSFLDMVQSSVNFLKSIMSNWPIRIPYFDKLVDLVGGGTTDISTSAMMGAVKETSNILFIHGIDTKQRYLQQSGQPIYYYRFSYETERSLHKLLYNVTLDGVAHGDDFAYLFHMTVTSLPLNIKDPTFIVRKRIVRMWTNFAKYSNPTPDGKNDQLLQGLTWPESGPSGMHLDIDENMTVGKRPTSITVQLYELMNNGFLPLKTGCTTSTLSAVANLATKPITSLFKSPK